MKKIIFLLSFLFIVGTVGAADLKLALVDLQKVFAEYGKTKEAEAQLKERQGAYVKERQEMLNEYQKVRDEATKLRDQAQDKTLSEATRSEKNKAYETKVQDLGGMERKIREFEVQRGKAFDDQMRRMRQGIVEEIGGVVKDFASKEKYNLVLDKTGATVSGTAVVLYSSDIKEITDDIIKLLNAKSPAAPATPAKK